MSPLPPPNEPKTPTYASERAAVDKDIRALWRRIDNLGKGGGGGEGLVIIAEEEPDVGQGSLWYDTDAGV